MEPLKKLPRERQQNARNPCAVQSVRFQGGEKKAFPLKKKKKVVNSSYLRESIN